MGTDAREAFWRWLTCKGGCRHDWHYTGPHGTGWLAALREANAAWLSATTSRRWMP